MSQKLMKFAPPNRSHSGDAYYITHDRKIAVIISKLSTGLYDRPRIEFLNS